MCIVRRWRRSQSKNKRWRRGFRFWFRFRFLNFEPDFDSDWNWRNCSYMLVQLLLETASSFKLLFLVLTYLNLPNYILSQTHPLRLGNPVDFTLSSLKQLRFNQLRKKKSWKSGSVVSASLIEQQAAMVDLRSNERRRGISGKLLYPSPSLSLSQSLFLPTYLCTSMPVCVMANQQSD